MPFVDESFDFAYCSAAFKNFPEPVKILFLDLIQSA
jgi:ubiquinone/menaquinone biosynthesis C-methylase UbiE